MIWSHLGCLGQKVNVFTQQGIFNSCMPRNHENLLDGLDANVSFLTYWTFLP